MIMHTRRGIVALATTAALLISASAPAVNMGEPRGWWSTERQPGYSLLLSQTQSGAVYGLATYFDAQGNQRAWILQSWRKTREDVYEGPVYAASAPQPAQGVSVAAVGMGRLTFIGPFDCEGFGPCNVRFEVTHPTGQVIVDQSLVHLLLP